MMLNWMNSMFTQTSSSSRTNLISFIKHGLVVQRLSSTTPYITGHASVGAKSRSSDWTKSIWNIQQKDHHIKSCSNSICSVPLRTFKRDSARTFHRGGQDAGESHDSESTDSLTLHNITHRSLVCVEGPDSVSFLQGLLTSDVTLLDSSRPVQYSMMLNAQGRVLYDLILYVMDSKIFIECDAKVRDEFMQTIKKYKIRKKVQINKVDGEWMLQAVITSYQSRPCAPPSWNESVFCVADPRVNHFGWRLIHQASCDKVCAERLEEKDVSTYNEYRYTWGISEGVDDLPPGECFPLESNLALFNGVSFDKGCYIGQELTARTQHTGVTRKRLMPIVFERVPSGLQPGCKITRADGKNVGKFRSCVGVHGIGLLRLAEVKGELCVHNSNGDVFKLTAYIPHWWPK